VSKTSYVIAAVVAAALAGAGAWFYWQQQHATPAAVEAPPPVAEAAPAEPAAVASAASEPAIQHPIPAPAADAAAAPTSIESALAELFDRKTLLAMFQTQDVARRVVATVDNLGRAHAPVALWPVNPTPGRLAVENRNGADQIGADNAARYAPFVALVESVDLAKAAGLYVRLYPQLQQAYGDIGFPRRYFNDRLVAVLDQLLATPQPSEPLKVHLPQINGPVKPERPWVLYEFDDPALQSLSAGQRILLRMGPDNERRLKLRITELRRLVTAGATKP
jgi:hypothetical protein